MRWMTWRATCARPYSERQYDGHPRLAHPAAASAATAQPAAAAQARGSERGGDSVGSHAELSARHGVDGAARFAFSSPDQGGGLGLFAGSWRARETGFGDVEPGAREPALGAAGM